MIKITLANGHAIELNGVDEIPAAVPVVSMLLGGAITVVDQMTAPTLPVAPEIVGDEIDDDDDETSTTSRSRTRIRVPNPPAPAGRWPELIFLTDVWNRVYSLLREYPDGLTSEEMAILLDHPDKSLVSGWAMRLREATPLVELKGRVHRLTEIGADPTLTVAINNTSPSKANKALGWQRFMACKLRDGRQKRRRRS